MTSTIALIYPIVARRDDAIYSYSLRLAEALAATASAEAFVTPLGGPDGALRHSGRLDACILQYNPYAYGRWGIAPRLMWDWWRLKRRTPVCAITIHEAFVSRPESAKGWLLEIVHRLQVAVLCRGNTKVWSTSRERSEQIRKWIGSATITEMPVGSNIGEAVEAADVVAVRNKLGASPEHLVVATLGKRSGNHQLDFVAEAMRSICKGRDNVVILRLGSEGPDLPADLDPIAPGFLAEEELAAYVAASDLLLLPYSCGAATNRGTLMSALALARPVLTTESATTDPALRGTAIGMTDVGDLEAFRVKALNLSRDRELRSLLGQRAGELYAQEFSWRRLAQRTLATLALVPSEDRAA